MITRVVLASKLHSLLSPLLFTLTLSTRLQFGSNLKSAWYPSPEVWAGVRPDTDFCLAKNLSLGQDFGQELNLTQYVLSGRCGPMLWLTHLVQCPMPITPSWLPPWVTICLRPLCPSLPQSVSDAGQMIPQCTVLMPGSGPSPPAKGCYAWPLF